MVGALDEDLPYVSARLEMKWASFGFGDNSPITFWGYATDDMIFSLAGSKHHLLGQSRQNSEFGYATSHSLTIPITNWLLDKFGEPVDEKLSNPFTRRVLNKFDIANAIYLAVTQMSGQESNLEFVAKVLHRSTWGKFRFSQYKKIILATPLYVALVE